MMDKNLVLAVEDPLANQDVTILITVIGGEQPRDERPALVSVGVAEQAPAIKTGLFGALPTLIADAWTAFAWQMQLPVAAPPATRPAELVAEEQITAPVVAAAPKPPSPPPPPRPQASNLSLF